MAHEQSITVEFDGIFYLIPTVFKGKKLKDKDAAELFRRGEIKSLGAFRSQREAKEAADKRSESQGRRKSLATELLE